MVPGGNGRYVNSARQAPLPIVSVFYGPVLLAAEESAPRNDWRPISLDAGDLAKSVTGDPATLRFTIDGVSFKPYFETCGRNSVYQHVTLK